MKVIQGDRYFISLGEFKMPRHFIKKINEGEDYRYSVIGFKYPRHFMLSANHQDMVVGPLWSISLSLPFFFIKYIL